MRLSKLHESPDGLPDEFNDAVEHARGTIGSNVKEVPVEVGPAETSRGHAEPVYQLEGADGRVFVVYHLDSRHPITGSLGYVMYEIQGRGFGDRIMDPTFKKCLHWFGFQKPSVEEAKYQVGLFFSEGEAIEESVDDLRMIPVPTTVLTTDNDWDEATLRACFFDGGVYWFLVEYVQSYSGPHEPEDATRDWFLIPRLPLEGFGGRHVDSAPEFDPEKWSLYPAYSMGEMVPREAALPSRNMIAQGIKNAIAFFGNVHRKLTEGRDEDTPANREAFAKDALEEYEVRVMVPKLERPTTSTEVTWTPVRQFELRAAGIIGGRPQHVMKTFVLFRVEDVGDDSYLPPFEPKWMFIEIKVKEGFGGRIVPPPVRTEPTEFPGVYGSDEEENYQVYQQEPTSYELWRDLLNMAGVDSR